MSGAGDDALGVPPAAQRRGGRSDEDEKERRSLSEVSGPADARGGRGDSRDESHGLGCAQVIAEVWTLLDGECSPEARDELRRHLEACPGCFKHYGIEERIKALIAVKCKGEKAPEGLKERLRLEIRRTTIIRGIQQG